ncbi:MAG: O-antigen ligase family protein [Symploca sp. SIO1A3]|nr:O-antigen ligase family protein [Symploca sp. SIO1A3]
MNLELNPLLKFLEKRATIFALLFLSEMLRFDSLYSDPDPRADVVAVGNPLDPVMSLLQHSIYAATFLLMLARWKSVIRAALRDQIIWLLAGIVLASFLWSDFPDWSLKKSITTVQTTYFGLYLASRYNFKQQLQMLAWAIGIITIVSLLFTLAFPGAAIEAGANAGAWRGPFVQKNVLARIMVMGAIVFLLLALDSRRKRYLFWGGFGLCILMILLTGSKTALLLFLFVVILLPLYKALRWRDTILVPLIITLLLVAGSIAVLIVGNWENILVGLGRDPTLSGRTDLWELAIELISKRPWLGYGYQGFWIEDGVAEIIWKAEGYRPPHAHNGFVNITLDLGLVGLFLFLLIIAVTYLRAIAWLRLGKTTIELWPIFYVTFFFMYNHSENTIIAHNSLFWALLSSVIFSMKRLRPAQPSKPTKEQKQTKLVKHTF